MLLKVSNFFNIGKLEPDFKLFPNVHPYSCFVVHFSIFYLKFSPKLFSPF